MFEQSVDSILSIWASMNSWFTSTVLFVLLNVMIGTIAITSSRGAQKHSNRQQEAQEHPQQPQIARSPSILQRFKSINFYSYRSQETTTAFEQTTDSYTHYASNQNLETEQPQLSRSPSMLRRLKSISLSNYRFQEQPNPSISLEESDTHYSNFQQPRETEDEEEEEEEEEAEEEEEEEEEEELAQASDQDEEVDQYDEQTLDEIYGKLQGAQVSRTRSDTKPASGEVPVKLSRKMKKSASAKSAFVHFEEEDIVEIRRPETVRERKVGVTEDDDDEVNARADDFINRFKQQLKLQRLDSIIRYKDANIRASGK
ncbi:pathogen-associated molecular patterns-induced protein A70-like [Corylus avellana]|uniref:pathogen-associated molecular patterns-induced protein A70-like n=1 Tax=Corylus avellana TaxID=13451 RepID=UPI001E23072F|nr:pathogen-associated molecular patterns-induced protein A70-like [Corylus avellana]